MSYKFITDNGGGTRAVPADQHDPGLTVAATYGFRYTRVMSSLAQTTRDVGDRSFLVLGGGLGALSVETALAAMGLSHTDIPKIWIDEVEIDPEMLDHHIDIENLGCITIHEMCAFRFLKHLELGSQPKYQAVLYDLFGESNRVCFGGGSRQDKGRRLRMAFNAGHVLLINAIRFEDVRFILEQLGSSAKFVALETEFSGVQAISRDKHLALNYRNTVVAIYHQKPKCYHDNMCRIGDAGVSVAIDIDKRICHAMSDYDRHVFDVNLNNIWLGEHLTLRQVLFGH